MGLGFPLFFCPFPSSHGADQSRCSESNSTSHLDDPKKLQKSGTNAFFATDWTILLSPAPRPKKEAVYHLCYRRNNPVDPDQLEKQNCCTFLYWNWAFGVFHHFDAGDYSLLIQFIPNPYWEALQDQFCQGGVRSGDLECSPHMYKRTVKKKTDRRGRFRTQPVTFMEIKVVIMMDIM